MNLALAAEPILPFTIIDCTFYLNRTVKYTEELQGFSSHSEEENDNENSSDSESGLASGHKSSSSLSVSTDGDSDSPVPTSELSDSSHQINNSSDELSSSNSDIITWRTR